MKHLGLGLGLGLMFCSYLLFFASPFLATSLMKINILGYYVLMDPKRSEDKVTQN